MTASTDPVRGSSLLLAGRAFSILVNMGFQVVLVRYLSQSDFGVVAYGVTVASLVQVVVSLGQERSVSRFIVFYEEQGRPDRVLGTLALYVSSVAVLGTVAFVITIVIGDSLTGGLDNPAGAAVVAILVLMAPLDSLDMMMQSTYAAFSKTKKIFVRKYVANPLIKVGLVLLVAVTHQPVEFVAVAFVATSLIGVLIYGSSASAILKERGIWKRPIRENLEVPTGDVLRFSLPLISSPFVWTAFGLGTSTVLAWQYDSIAVADFRAIWPVARLNMVVSSTFSVLFLPSLARHVAQANASSVRESYWRTSAWVAMLTMPVFFATVPLARDTTLLLFGERYASSASVLAIVATGVYIDVIFGFNRQTLELYNRVWWVVGSDIATVIANLALSLVLIPPYGAQGAAAANTIALIARNIVNQSFVVRLTPVSWFDPRYLRVYVSLLAGLFTLAVVQVVVAPWAVVSFAIAAIISLVALRANRGTLEITTTFPEVKRLPLLGRWVS